VARGNYNLNEATAREKELLSVLRILSALNSRGDVQPVTLYQQEGACGKWVLATQGKEFKDLSLQRVIERAGRALTTVYDR
jgi:hypothetical protein